MRGWLQTQAIAEHYNATLGRVQVLSVLIGTPELIWAIIFVQADVRI